MFLEISQNLQENTYASLFNEVADLRHFPVNFAKFLGTPFLTEHLLWLFVSQENEGDQALYSLFAIITKNNGKSKKSKNINVHVRVTMYGCGTYFLSHSSTLTNLGRRRIFLCFRDNVFICCMFLKSKRNCCSSNRCCS